MAHDHQARPDIHISRRAVISRSDVWPQAAIMWVHPRPPRPASRSNASKRSRISRSVRSISGPSTSISPSAHRMMYAPVDKPALRARTLIASSWLSLILKLQRMSFASFETIAGTVRHCTDISVYTLAARAESIRERGGFAGTRRERPGSPRSAITGQEWSATQDFSRASDVLMAAPGSAGRGDYPRRLPARSLSRICPVP
jgi:hypothetical protein